MVDWLLSRGIHPVMFSCGAFGRDPEAVAEVIRRGIVVGNHSFTHPAFSSLTEEACIAEIEQQETLLNEAYRLAGVERKYKLFRFPYLDKGGSNAAAVQRYLRSNGFVKVRDDAVCSGPYTWSKGRENLDVVCSYDVAEYQLKSSRALADQFYAPDKALNLEDAKRKMRTPNPRSGDYLFDGGTHIILLHAHDDTEALFPGYYRELVEYMLDNGVEFLEPEFVGE